MRATTTMTEYLNSLIPWTCLIPRIKNLSSKLGLRTTAAYTAWYRGHKKWSQHDFKEDSYLRGVLREYPSLQTACDAISEWVTQESSAGRNLEKEMVRWQNLLPRIGLGIEQQVKSEKSNHLLRIAATGIPGPQDCPVAMTMLPTANGECLLVVTILEGENKDSLAHQEAASDSSSTGCRSMGEESD